MGLNEHRCSNPHVAGFAYPNSVHSSPAAPEYAVWQVWSPLLLQMRRILDN